MRWGVILAGGKGERFWPLSRETRPKQLLRLVSDKTLLEEAAGRARAVAERLMVITNREIEGKVRELVPDALVIAEPVGKNTAPACLWSAWVASREDPDARLLVLPSDHVITDKEAFARAAEAALDLAEEGYLVTFGVKPTRPETGYGYIERGEPLGERRGIRVFRVRRFHEKPERETAEVYLASGRFYWNSGMFAWRADVVIDGIKTHAPDVYRALGPSLDEFYAKAPSISVDYALMERADNIAVVEAIFDWEDAGSFSALLRLLPQDQDGNVCLGEGLLVGCRGSVAVSEGGLVALWGVSDLVVVHTPDVTLVVPVQEAQRVKELLHRLRERPGTEGYYK